MSYPMELLKVTLESFTLIDKAEKLLKGRRDYFVSVTLRNPRADGKNIEALIPLKKLAAGETLTFDAMEGYEKEIMKSFLLPDTHLILSFYAVKNSSKFLAEMKKYITAGAAAGLSLISGGTAMPIVVAVTTEMAKSAVSAIPNKKKTTRLGKGFFSYTMMKESPNGKIPLKALNKVLVETRTDVNKETGEITQTKRYLPGGFGIAELDLKFTFLAPVVA